MKRRMIRLYGLRGNVKQRGFTLMELLVVIVLLGVLATLGLSSFMSSQTKSRDTKRKGDLKSISNALEIYYNDKGRYPNDAGDGRIMGCGAGDVLECPWGGQFVDANGTQYMAILSKDPSKGKRYFYDVAGGNQSYQMYARLENTLDNDVQKDASDNPYAYSGLYCDDANNIQCNWGIASVNTSPNTGRTLVVE
jgi:type II secretion system protein G